MLNTQLDKATLATCVGMVENGVNPEALAVCPYLHQLWTEITSISLGCNPGAQERIFGGWATICCQRFVALSSTTFEVPLRGSWIFFFWQITRASTTVLDIVVQTIDFRKVEIKSCAEGTLPESGVVARCQICSESSDCSTPCRWLSYNSFPSSPLPSSSSAT